MGPPSTTPRTNLPILAALVLLAGCLSEVPDPNAPVTGRNVLAPGPDHRSFSETEAREFDVVADRNDPDHVSVAYVIPRVDEVSGSWLSFAKTRDGGQTWTIQPFCGDPLSPSPGLATCPFAGARITSDPVLVQLADGDLLYVGVMLNAADVTQFAARFPPDAMEPASVSVVSRSAFDFFEGAQMLPAPYEYYYNGKANLMQDESGALHLVWAANLQGVDTVEPVTGLPFWTTSTDGGRTWSTPIALSDSTFSDVGSMYAVGVEAFQTIDGRFHATWWESITNALYQVSSDDGKRFTSVRRIAPALARPTQAAVDSDNLTRPWVGIDRSGGPWHGSVYLLFDDLSTGDRDLYFLISRDNATTWSKPVRLGTIPLGNGRDETMARLLLEPDGAISVLYPSWEHLERWSPYEMRLSRSIDGAATFQDVLLSSAFSPINNPGDYNDLDRTSQGILAIWEDGREGPSGTRWMFQSLILTE